MYSYWHGGRRMPVQTAERLKSPPSPLLLTDECYDCRNQNQEYRTRGSCGAARRIVRAGRVASTIVDEVCKGCGRRGLDADTGGLDQAQSFCTGKSRDRHGVVIYVG